MCSIPIPRWRSLRGFAHNRRVMVQGYHGTGKSTHIEQGRSPAQLAEHPGQSRMPISAASIWSGAMRFVLKDGLQVTEFKEGILPWAPAASRRADLRRIMTRASPDVMFVDPADSGIRWPVDPARSEPG